MVIHHCVSRHRCCVELVVQNTTSAFHTLHCLHSTSTRPILTTGCVLRRISTGCNSCTVGAFRCCAEHWAAMAQFKPYRVRHRLKNGPGTSSILPNEKGSSQFTAIGVQASHTAQRPSTA
ncbi:hypothetical protein C8T65DRAFT_627497 [Cerioporus squamosus]|nr:hypothetical protein C8T65DRAFT_627497 [Cerioporus squamosus]